LNSVKGCLGVNFVKIFFKKNLKLFCCVDVKIKILKYYFNIFFEINCYYTSKYFINLIHLFNILFFIDTLFNLDYIKN
jgi:hypothetical protein